MNIHKKITEMGFRKCSFHKPEWNRESGKDEMVIDNYIVDNKWDRETRKYIRVLKKKDHPKWDTFYKMQFTKDITLWLYLEKTSIIKYIWIEGDKIDNGVKLIYDWAKPPCQINSKIDIIRLFPKEIQRDFLINSII